MLHLTELLAGRFRTAEAIAELLLAQATIRIVPVRSWPIRFGLSDNAAGEPYSQILAYHVERGVRWLPFTNGCLPRAMALARMLKRRRIAHCLVIAAQPRSPRHSRRALHAWIEVNGTVVFGDLPGPWIPVLRLP